MGSIASSLEQTYSVASSEYKNFNVDMWAQESFEITKKYVYNGTDSMS